MLNIDEIRLALDDGMGRGECIRNCLCWKIFVLGWKGHIQIVFDNDNITISAAAVEAIRPNFQFSTTAQSEDMLQLHTDLMKFVP